MTKSKLHVLVFLFSDTDYNVFFQPILTKSYKMHIHHLSLMTT